MRLDNTHSQNIGSTAQPANWASYQVSWAQCLRHGLRGSLIQQLGTAKQLHGDYLRIRILGPLGFYVLSDPSAIAHVMVKNQHNYIRGEPSWTHLRRGLGNGLVTSDGEVHRQHRKIVLQSFTRKMIMQYGSIVSDACGHLHQQWREQSDTVIDIYQSMVSHTLLIIGRILFGLDLSDQVVSLAQASQQINHSATTIDCSLLGRAGFIPTRGVRRLNKAVQVLDSLLFELIAQRKTTGIDGPDVLSALLRHQAANINHADPNQRLSDRDIRDELATLLGAGHETSACMLSWTWLLLARNPQSWKTLQTELKRVLNGRPPRPEDVEKLTYTKQVLYESMRLYPPVWINGRQAVDEDQVNGYRIKANMMLWIPSYLVHHDARWYPQPEKFLPERFGTGVNHSDFRFFPFGGGSRLCIGAGFAVQEGILTLASLAQHFYPQEVKQAPIIADPMVSLTPRDGIQMLIKTHV